METNESVGYVMLRPENMKVPMQMISHLPWDFIFQR